MPVGPSSRTCLVRLHDLYIPVPTADSITPFGFTVPFFHQRA
jgi:hypothetical protein